MEQVKKILEEVGVKPSVQRLAILKYLMEHKTHPSVDEIYSALNPSMPTLSKTTVYNTLKLLSDSAAILTLEIDENCSRFDADTAPHSHFLCKRCGKVFDFPMPKMELMDVEKKFEIQEKYLYMKGICDECLKKNV